MSLSNNGDVLAVGASEEAGASQGIDGDQSAGGQADESSGAVYVFRRTGPSWQQEAYIKSSNAEGGDRFGRSISLSGEGNRLAVSATGEDSGATRLNGNQNYNSANESGAVYIFIRNGTWSQKAYVKASNTGAADMFGSSVALSSGGDLLVVGANGEAGSTTDVNGSEADDGALNAGAV